MKKENSQQSVHSPGGFGGKAQPGDTAASSKLGDFCS